MRGFMDCRTIFQWVPFSSWESDVWSALVGLVDQRAKERFLAEAAQTSDSYSNLLSRIASEQQGHKVCVVDHLAFQLPQIYTHIRAFHGARPIDPTPYYSEGIRRHDAEHLHEIAREVFLSGDYPEITPEILEGIIQSEMMQQQREARRGQVCFALDHEAMIQGYNHYMAYGSEYLQAIACQLPGAQHQYLTALAKRGQAVVFSCDVPVSLIPEEWFYGITPTVMDILLERIINPSYMGLAGGSPCMMIFDDLPASCVLEHSEPRLLVDTLTWRGPPS